VDHKVIQLLQTLTLVTVGQEILVRNADEVDFSLFRFIKFRVEVLGCIDFPTEVSLNIGVCGDSGRVTRSCFAENVLYKVVVIVVVSPSVGIVTKGHEVLYILSFASHDICFN